MRCASPDVDRLGDQTRAADWLLRWMAQSRGQGTVDWVSVQAGGSCRFSCLGAKTSEAPFCTCTSPNRFRQRSTRMLHFEPVGGRRHEPKLEYGGSTLLVARPTSIKALASCGSSAPSRARQMPGRVQTIGANIDVQVTSVTSQEVQQSGDATGHK